ncbi:adenosylcobinamide-GDP ribazoletransferase [Nocardiopsis sediminis]|uniref:Adenosylcobinamide-GDP ribazoletransferase n=1 Tax=Nocardiopsis sediminis TaxID=1778267 RepID=A0ABV8FRN4_9ACTN
MTEPGTGSGGRWGRWGSLGRIRWAWSARDAADGGRLALGTLTVFPVRVQRVNRTAAGWAMTLSPAAGLLLGAVAGAVLFLAGLTSMSPLLGAALAIGALALLTRGLHLDGLADLADGLGSARPAGEALDIMKRSDIGPFGVVTLVMVLLVQVLALGDIAATSSVAAVGAVVVATMSGRLAITWSCTPRTRPAREEGLGALVVGSVPVGAAITTTGAVALLAGLTGLPHSAAFALSCVAAVAGGQLAATALRWHAKRRLGGITGDVLGALCETATTTPLVILAALTA